MKLSLRPLHLRPITRTYATRRPEKPPPKIRDPLLSPSATHYQVAPNLTFIHRPPPTTPTPFSLTTDPSSPLLRSSLNDQFDNASTSDSSRRLPPPIRKQLPKPMQRLNEKQIEEMRRLRAADPAKYTRQKLAEQFGCSPFFVPIAAPLSNTENRKALERRDQVHESNRRRWGERKQMARAIRQKRRSLW